MNALLKCLITLAVVLTIAACGGGGGGGSNNSPAEQNADKSAAVVDPPTLDIDSQVLPDAATIEGIDGGEPRPLSKLAVDIGAGYEVNFVQNEVYLLTDDPGEKEAFVARWRGNVLSEVDVNTELGISDAPVMYLIQVDASAADPTNLADRLAVLDPRIHGAQRVSDEAALKLIALVADERQNHGLRVGLNVLLKSQGFPERLTTEAVSAAATPDSTPYTRNAYDWNYLNRNPDVAGDDYFPHDTGVAEAWRVLQATGHMVNHSRVAILDGGFIPNADFPDGWVSGGALRIENPDPTHCGAAPADPDLACRWHGTHVVLTGFGKPDNEFGTAGPGAPVSDVVVMQSPALDVASVGRYLIRDLPRVMSGVKIVNISAAIAIPGGWCFAICEPLDVVTSALNRYGTLVVAAAGNEGADVDATDEVCVGLCVEFEEAAYIPCESDKVLCVGATGWNDNGRADFSNFGFDQSDTNSVDIYAPGFVWSVADATAADEDLASPVDNLDIIQGTSFASPFVAGVAALIRAADPSLTPDQIVQRMLATAHTNSRTAREVHRRVNALAAVRSVLGDTPPFITITSPVSGTAFEAGSDAVALRASVEDLDDGTGLPVSWSSDIDLGLGSGASLNLGPDALSVGTHHITATTHDSAGHVASTSIELIVFNSMPRVFIDSPASGSSSYQGQAIQLLGRSLDLNEPGHVLPAENVTWYLESTTPSGVIGTGYEWTIPAGSLAVGTHDIYFQGIDSFGVAAAHRSTIEILADPADLPPEVAITDPANGASFNVVGNSGYVNITIGWTATDDHDVIGFGNLIWKTKVNGGAEEALSVYPVTVPGSSVVFYQADLRVVPGATDTVHEIRLYAFDNATPANYTPLPAKVLVHLLQLI